MEQLLEQSLEGRGIQLLPVRGRCWRSSDGSAAAPDSGTAGTHLVDESIMHQLCGQILGVISCRDKEQENMNMDTVCGNPVPGRATAGAAHPGNIGEERWNKVPKLPDHSSGQCVTWKGFVWLSWESPRTVPAAEPARGWGRSSSQAPFPSFLWGFCV